MRNDEVGSGRWCLISGSNRGIGNAVMKCFAMHGWNIVAHSRRQPQELAAELKQMGVEYGVRVESACFDLTDRIQMKQEIKRIVQSGINISCLVNCAGIASFKFFPFMRVAEVKEVFEVNLFSSMELTQLVLKGMMKNKCGTIVNVSSIAGFDLKTNNAAYGVSKSAVNAFTKELAMEMGQFNIRVNAVAPGIINTDMVQELSDESYKE